MSPNSLRPIPRMTRARWVMTALLAPVLLTPGCDNSAADNDATNTYVFAANIESDDDSDFILSDVCLNPDDIPGFCSVVNDNATVTMFASAKDQTKFVDPLINDIFFTRYRVTYIRSDGRNVPGVDVPHPFEGGTSFSVPVGGEADQAFLIVRHQAKAESPLSELRQGGGALILSVIAQVEFFGQDGTGRQVKAVGNITISFADFADEE